MVTCEQKNAQILRYKKAFEGIRTSLTPPIKSEMGLKGKETFIVWV